MSSQALLLTAAGRIKTKAFRLFAAMTGLALLASCANGTTGGFTVTGTVDSNTEAVTIPIFTISTSPGNSPSGSPAGLLGLGSTARISAVMVQEGDTVTIGQTVASVDSYVLAAAVSIAEANQQAARAQVDVLTAAIAGSHDTASTIEENKRKIDNAIRQASKAQSQMAKALKQLKALRPELAEKLATAKQLLDNYPPVAPPGTPSQAELATAIKELTAAIKALDKNIAKIKKAQPKLAEALRQARQARQKLNDASVKIVDARAALRDAKELALIAADASAIPVAIAEAQLSLTELSAPVTGVVTYVAQVGDQLAPGAKVVEIRPAAPVTVTAWLSPAQAAQICLGDTATIVGDWMAKGIAVEASLTSMASNYQYPPTDVTTDEIHLTRALEVHFEVTNSELPPGVPVDITVIGCRANQAEQNG